MSEAKVSVIEGAAQFRHVLGQFPTGVVGITSVDVQDRPIGMVIGSFASVSLDPELVGFMAAKSSSTWPAIRSSGRFLVNVLAHDQELVCRKIAGPTEQRFTDLAWSRTASGLPLLADVVSMIECDIVDVHDAGDHEIVVGRVRNLAVQRAAQPLLFVQGAYGQFASSVKPPGADVGFAALLTAIEAARPHMRRLADQFQTEVTALAVTGGELMLVAAEGQRNQSEIIDVPIGHRLPYRAPLGAVFAAGGSDEELGAWIRAVNPRTRADEESCRAVIERIRRDGYALAVAPSVSTHISALMDQYKTSPTIGMDIIRAELETVMNQYNPAQIEGGQVDFRFVTAPVTAGDASPVLTLSVWGPLGPASTNEVTARVHALLEATRQISNQLT